MDKAELISWIPILHDEIKEMRMLQKIFNEMRELIVGNYTINVPNPFYGFMRVAYADAISLSIRRQIDRDRRSISLLRVMQDAAAVVPEIDTATAELEILYLLDNTKLLKAYTNNRIAHSDKKFDADIPGWANVDLAVDIINTLFKRYARLLTGEEYDTTPPVPDDWKSIFYTPWLGDNLQHIQRRH